MRLYPRNFINRLSCTLSWTRSQNSWCSPVLKPLSCTARVYLHSHSNHSKAHSLRYSKRPLIMLIGTRTDRCTEYIQQINIPVTHNTAKLHFIITASASENTWRTLCNRCSSDESWALFTWVTGAMNVANNSELQAGVWLAFQYMI